MESAKTPATTQQDIQIEMKTAPTTIPPPKIQATEPTTNTRKQRLSLNKLVLKGKSSIKWGAIGGAGHLKDLVKSVHARNTKAREEVDHSISHMMHSVNHLSDLFEDHNYPNDKDHHKNQEEKTNKETQPNQKPPPLSMPEVIKLLACKEKIQLILDNHSYYHGSTTLHPNATTATVARQKAQNSNLYGALQAGMKTRSKGKERKKKKKVTLRSTTDPTNTRTAKDTNANKDIEQNLDASRDSNFSTLDLVLDEDYNDSDDENERTSSGCCCCKSTHVTDIQRAAVLLDDAMRLRTPFHDMESSLQIKIWELLGAPMLRSFYQIVALLYSFILAAWTQASTNANGSHVTRNQQFTGEAVLLGLIILHLVLTGYAYGSFVCRYHKFFVLVCVVTLASFIDWIVAVSYYTTSEVYITRYIFPFHMVYLPYFVPKIREYMKMTIRAGLALKNVLILVVLWLLISFVVLVYMSPKGCQFPELKSCAPTNDTTLLYGHSIVQCGEKLNEFGEDGICGTSLYKTRTGAMFAQGEVYAKDPRDIFMSMFHLLLGSVNYPDISLPGITTMSKAYYLPWFIFLFVGVVYLLNLVLSVVYIEFINNYGVSYQKRWKLFRETLFRAMILVDKDGSGQLEFNEFQALFHELNDLAFHQNIRGHVETNVAADKVPLDVTLTHAFVLIDSDHTGSINKEEFLEICNTLLGEDYTPKWIHPTKWDITTATLEQLKKRVHDSVRYLKEKRESIVPDMTLKGASNKQFRLMQKKIKTMERRSVYLETDVSDRSFVYGAANATCWSRFMYGGLFPSLRHWLLNQWFIFGTNCMTLLAIISAALCVINAWWSVDCKAHKDWKAAETTFLVLEWVCVGLFFAEMCYKILAVGLSGYWHTGWWRFDGSLTLISLGLLILFAGPAIDFQCYDEVVSEATRVEKLEILRKVLTLRILKLVQAFRIMRIWARTSGLRELAVILNDFTFGPFIYWIGLIFTLLIPFAHVASMLWGNRLRWKNPTSDLAESAYMASGDFTFPSQVGYNGTTTIHSPYARVVNFDDFAMSVITLAMIAFQNNWHIIYEAAFKSYDEEAPGTDKRAWGEAGAVVIFILYLILAVLVVLNLLVSHFLQMYQTTMERKSNRKKKAFKIFHSMQMNEGITPTFHSYDGCYQKLRYYFCAAKCQLTGMWVGPDDYVWMIAPQLGQGYEPISVDVAIALELIGPDATSELSRFIHKEQKSKKATAAIDVIRQEAEVLLGVEKAHRVAHSTGSTKEIHRLFKEASMIEKKWLKGHHKSFGTSKSMRILHKQNTLSKMSGSKPVKAMSMAPEGKQMHVTIKTL